MLSTRKIKRKIRSVNNIKKITRAMEMVSAAKLKKVQEKLTAIRPYSVKLQEIMNNLLVHLPSEAIDHPLLTPHLLGIKESPLGLRDSGQVGAGRTIALITIAADKGLCGGYNTNLIKTATGFINEQPESRMKIVALGRKTQDHFRRHGFELISTYTRLSTDFNFRNARSMIEPVVKQYEQRTLNEVWLAYTEFVNSMVYKPRLKRLVPILTDEAVGVPSGTNSSGINALLPRSTRYPYGYLFEPEPKIILNQLVPRYIEVVFYQIVLESMASEHAARMVAMRNATDNAEEVIKDLTLSFNKARQASITMELLDIIGGAEAMR